jgi:hypothetical protein
MRVVHQRAGMMRTMSHLAHPARLGLLVCALVACSRRTEPAAPSPPPAPAVPTAPAASVPSAPTDAARGPAAAEPPPAAASAPEPAPETDPKRIACFRTCSAAANRKQSEGFVRCERGDAAAVDACKAKVLEATDAARATCRRNCESTPRKRAG